MTIKVFLMQNLSMVALPLLRYDVTKVSSEEVSKSSNSARADQNTGVALLEFPMRTAMHGNLAFGLQYLSI